MWQFIRDYFTFDKRQRNGVFVLLCIILLLLIYLSFSDYFFSQEEIDFSRFEKEVAEFENTIKQLKDSEEARKNYFSGKNILISDTEKTKERQFEKKKFSSFKHKRDGSKNYSAKKTSEIIELNTADTSLLKQLRGIGSVFAQRIIKFRDELGGFVRKEQLLEVRGFDKQKFGMISPYVKIDSSKVKKININTASVETLKKHPYINKKLAAAIYWHRFNHGNYSDVSDILKENLVDERTFVKIAPYLSIE